MLKELLGNIANDAVPPYSAFSTQTLMRVSSSPKESAWKKLNHIAEVMRMYRGWGYSKDKTQSRKINWQATRDDTYPEKISDRNWMYDYAKDRHSAPNALAASMVFGLPRNYGMSLVKWDLKFEPTAGGQDISPRTRRASPLFIHIHQFPDGKTAAVQSFIPATFMPQEDFVQPKRKKFQKKEGYRDFSQAITNHQPNWDVMTGYLNFVGQGEEKDFSDWMTVNLISGGDHHE